mmetsp:Transcript_47365/g.94774  ORF Transcript_47365/g.94774 Transcript_47365/m.94774 type:complete len:147 (-) Transcript_47365:94-534(-)|eukprot:CAMPEP_0202833250 /NCGR_PEP_ID=MMETSP1389-20130828/24496_1 /ASSEMBLY_ACC=CAM_ASM_000865 /TAXON_ID=302021 /ORGANISM="Rhodomonas sp., Strain CCMP768" /LENGTH=146 /DNA_ID=CAMNT_0049507793 /DNA_START=119 /DNA_END=559 /DNA_ORIENTATION=+
MTRIGLKLCLLACLAKLASSVVSECYTNVDGQSTALSETWPVQANGPIQACPEGANVMCIKEIIKRDGEPTQYRGGCSGNPSTQSACYSMDNRQYETLADGSYDEVGGSYTFCLCATDNCNPAPRPFPPTAALLLLPALVLARLAW